MQSGRNNNPQNTQGYKDADHNYNSSLGSKDEFQRIYREAFIEGYRHGNDGYGPYGRGGDGQNAATELQRQAQQNRYTDGEYPAEKGMQGGRNNKPQDNQGYKEADQHQHSSQGSKYEF